jgi:hypothetical protein
MRAAFGGMSRHRLHRLRIRPQADSAQKKPTNGKWRYAETKIRGDRREERYPLACTVQISWQRASGESCTTRATCRDVSLHGARVECGELLSARSSVYLSAPSFGLMGNATVRYCRPTGHEIRAWSGIHVGRGSRRGGQEANLPCTNYLTPKDRPGRNGLRIAMACRLAHFPPFKYPSPPIVPVYAPIPRRPDSRRHRNQPRRQPEQRFGPQYCP